MKKANIISLFIVILVCFMPPKSIEAALVPVQKTSHQVKKIKKKKTRKYLKIQQKRLKKTRQKARKKHFKPEQQNEYEGLWITLIIIPSIYFITAILLTIFGFIYLLPGLWLTGIILLAVPLIILIVSIIKNVIEAKQYKKEQAAREVEEKRNNY